MSEPQSPPPGAVPGTAHHTAPPPVTGYVLRQPYPGAPPTYAPVGAPTPPPAGGNRSALSVTSLILGILCVVFGILPIFGTSFVAPLVVVTLIFAVIAISRPHTSRRLPVIALVLALVGILSTVSWSVLRSGSGMWPWESRPPLAGPSPPDAPFEPEIEEPDLPLPPELGVDGADGRGASRDDPLPYGTTVTIVDETTGAEVWAMTVDAPVDATTAASEASDPPPENGGYVALPVELTNLTDVAIDPAREFDYTLYAWLLTGEGGRASPAYLTAEAEFPTIWDLHEVMPGESVGYFEVFDVAPGVTGTGYLVLELPEGDQVYWGPTG